MKSPSPQLLQAVRESRLAISREYTGLLVELDFVTRFRNSFRRHPLRWIGGAAAAGLATTIFRFGGRKGEAQPSSPVPSGGKLARWISLLEIARTLYPVVQPVILELAGAALRRIASRRN